MLRRYDIVATNPPYMSSGNVNDTLARFLAQDYPDSKGDLYAAFLERCAEFLQDHGRLGMITQQTFMFISSYEKMRGHLLNHYALETMCHVGPRAFDAISGEKVNTTLFILRREPDSKRRDATIGTYFRLVKETDGNSKRERFETALARLKAIGDDSIIYRYCQSDFAAIPGSPWVYLLPPAIKNLFRKCKTLGSLEPVKEGINTGDNDRFVRFWWEIEPLLGFKENDRYVPFCKGGPKRKYYDQIDECILNDLVQMRLLPGSAMRNIEYSFKDAIAFISNASTSFRARYIPPISRFCSTGGRAVFPQRIPLFKLLGILNSNFFDYLLRLINPTLSFKVGDLVRLPMILNEKDKEIEILSKEAKINQNKTIQEIEASFEFIQPPDWRKGVQDVKERHLMLSEVELEINKAVYDLFSIGDEDRAIIEAEMTIAAFIDEGNNDGEEECRTEEGEAALEGAPLTREELARKWISYAVGIVLGRFAPGVEGGLGRGNFSPEVAAQLRNLATLDGILVMDEGHPDDLTARLLKALTLTVGEDEVALLVQAATGKSGPAEELLRQYLERQFFKLHIQQYRKRPVYWLLQSPRKKYGLWLFHEKLTTDTLLRLRAHYVEPKINLLQSHINDLQTKRDQAEGREKRQLQKEIEVLQDLLDDVRQFAQRFKFISEERGYAPHLDDGVLLNMAPLWELISSWQAEPKKAWQALEKGDYDWAYQAMDHWPARVRGKCQTNKSYAIAHGLA